MSPLCKHFDVGQVYSMSKDVTYASITESRCENVQFCIWPIVEVEQASLPGHAQLICQSQEAGKPQTQRYRPGLRICTSPGCSPLCRLDSRYIWEAQDWTSFERKTASRILGWCWSPTQEPGTSKKLFLRKVRLEDYWTCLNTTVKSVISTTKPWYF